MNSFSVCRSVGTAVGLLSSSEKEPEKRRKIVSIDASRAERGRVDSGIRRAGQGYHVGADGIFESRQGKDERIPAIFRFMEKCRGWYSVSRRRVMQRRKIGSGNSGGIITAHLGMCAASELPPFVTSGCRLSRQTVIIAMGNKKITYVLRQRYEDGM